MWTQHPLGLTKYALTEGMNEEEADGEDMVPMGPQGRRGCKVSGRSSWIMVPCEGFLKEYFNWVMK